MAPPNKNYFTLAEAFDRFGKLTYGSNWTGNELDNEQPFKPFKSSLQPEDDEGERYKRTRLAMLSRSWVRQQRYRRRHNLPHLFDVDPIWIGTSPRYRSEDIEAWIDLISACAAQGG